MLFAFDVVLLKSILSFCRHLPSPALSAVFIAAVHFGNAASEANFGKVVGGRDRRGDKVAGEILLSRLLKQSKN
jgi:hypothetical protein